MALITATVFVLLPLSFTQRDTPAVSHGLTAHVVEKVEIHPQWDTRHYVTSRNDTASFRERLRPDIKYLVQWGDPVGFSNQIISHIHLIYLALLSERVPVIPPFVHNPHVGWDGPLLSFGEVFDVDLLRAGLRKPVLQWSDVQAQSGVPEPLGCWGLEVWHGPAQAPPSFPHELGVSVVYTSIPNDSRSTYMHAADTLADLVHVSGSSLSESYRESAEALRPDEHIACFDFLYFVSSAANLNLDHSAGSFWPAWSFAGRYVRFTTAVRERAQVHLLQAFGLHPEAALPNFISVHIRRGDFVDVCENTPIEECFAPLSAYVRRVREVQEELEMRHGVSVQRVIVSSNEQNRAFWADIDRLGWAHIDYGTGVTNGGWWGIIVDTCIQSMSKGFVGTWGSTVSELSERRVRDWNNGASRMVRWGSVGADDH